MNQQHGQAVAELGRSISVIKSRLGEDARSPARVFPSFILLPVNVRKLSPPSPPPTDKLQELVDKAGGPEELPEERKEMEELKALLPEIQEKVEDANESLKVASAAKSVSRECKCLRGGGATRGVIVA